MGSGSAQGLLHLPRHVVAQRLTPVRRPARLLSVAARQAPTGQVWTSEALPDFKCISSTSQLKTTAGVLDIMSLVQKLLFQRFMFIQPAKGDAELIGFSITVYGTTLKVHVPS